MADLENYDPAAAGLQDLDDISNADLVIESLSSMTLTTNFKLDLRRCYVDYGPCSRVMEFLITRIGAMSGKKRIEIATCLDLGKSDHYCTLLFRNAGNFSGTERTVEGLRDGVSSRLRAACIELAVSVYHPVGAPSDPPFRTFDPLI